MASSGAAGILTASKTTNYHYHNMSTATQRPTPQNERVEKALQYLVELAELVILMERERDEALALAKNYSERWTAECKSLRGRLEAMREAIKEAHEALMLAPYRDQEALAKLQPFLKP